MEHANNIATNNVETSLEIIVTLLNTGLDKRTTKVLIDLIDSGIDPGSIADVIVELRQSTTTVRISSESKISQSQQRS